MNRNHIMRMARDSGAMIGVKSLMNCDGDSVVFMPEELERFVSKVAAAEREECATFVERKYVRQFDEPWRDNLAAAIRTRGEQ